MKLGIDRLRESPDLAKNWGNIGFLANQSSYTSDFKFSLSVVTDLFSDKLKCLFGPQHGFVATVQDNMIETDHISHPDLNIPIYSLYSETREPTEEMVQNIDTILIDIQIVGCRVYTFKYTIAGCLRAAKKFGKKVVVLDRPNPVGGVNVEGRVLDLSRKSFVGEFEIPMRHGLTPAEAALLFNASVDADLEIVSMEGWNPSDCWDNLGLEWILTSPNLPNINSVFSYPGTVIFEGSNVSEGRGTGLPFQFIGAPYIKDSAKFCMRVIELYGPSDDIIVRPTSFQPTSQKWVGKICNGLQIHVRSPKSMRSFALGLAILRASIEQGGSDFCWAGIGYEYDYEHLPIQLILGHPEADERLMSEDFSISDPWWNGGVSEWIERVEGYLLYPRKMSAI